MSERTTELNSTAYEAVCSARDAIMARGAELKLPAHDRAAVGLMVWAIGVLLDELGETDKQAAMLRIVREQVRP